MKKLYCILFSLLFCSVFAGNPNFQSGSSLAFYPNLGQISTDQGGLANSVHFKASVPGLEFYLTDEGLTYVFVQHHHDEYDPALGGSPTPNFQPTTDYARVDMVLVGAELNTQHIETSAKTQDYTNFYLAQCPEGRTNVYGYQEITYKNVYPNIDWVIYSDENNRLKYEFVVHPGGNPADIVLEYKYAQVEVGEKSIRLSTPMGNISEQNLYAYVKETNEEVEAYFQAAGNTVRVNVQAPTTGTLIIDPPLVWATYYGSSGEEQPQALVTSLNGFVFVAGYTNTTVFPTQNPGGGAYFQGSFAGSYDAFWVKFDTSGVRYWATYFGGSGSEGSTSYTGISIACGQGTDFWVLGTTNSTNMPTMNPGAGAYFQGSNAGGDDFFIGKYSIQTGVMQYSTYIGGSGSDGGSSHGNGADCDGAGNFYFSGRMNSTNFPLVNPGGGAFFDNTQNGSDDLVIGKMTPTGQLVWSTIFGGSGDDMNYSMDLHVDRQNARLYVGTCSNSNNLPCPNPGGGAYYDNTINGGTDIFLARFTLAGVHNYGTYIGGTSDEWLSMSIASAPDGDIAVMTLTGSTNMPMVNPGGTAFHDNTHNGGTWDMYLCRLETNMAMSWSTYYGSSNNDHCQHNLTMDFGGRIIMCGVSDGGAAPVTYNPGPGHFYVGVKDAQGTYCIVQYDTDGTMLWGTFYGGSGHDHLFGTVGGCIGVSAHSDIFVAAETNSTNLTLVNPGGGAYFQAANAGGGKEGFVLKFNNDIIPIILAIGLEQFTGYPEGKHNVLNWQLAENHGADRFLIEREVNGSFEFIDGVTATTATAFTWTDQQPLPGMNRYRLKIYDGNGMFSYSNVVEIRENASQVGVEIFPNPATDRLWIRLESDGNQAYQFELNDLTGRQVYSESLSGSGVWMRDLSKLAKGTYVGSVVEKQSGAVVHQSKVVLQ